MPDRSCGCCSCLVVEGRRGLIERSGGNGPCFLRCCCLGARDEALPIGVVLAARSLGNTLPDDESAQSTVAAPGGGGRGSDRLRHLGMACQRALHLTQF